MQIVPFCRRLAVCGFVSVLLSALVSAAPPDEAKVKPAAAVAGPAEKVRKDLDQTLAALPIQGATLKEVLDLLEEKAKLHFEIDDKAFNSSGLPDILGTDVTKSGAAELKNIKAKDALRKVLGKVPGQATFVVVGDRVVITTDTHAPYRLLKQEVSLDCEKEALSAAVKKLARETGMNFVVDARAAKEAETLVTLQVQDVTLETAIVLLAESGGIKPVLVGNVVFLTTKDNAKKMCFPEPMLDPITKMPLDIAPQSSLIGPIPLPDEYPQGAMAGM